MESPERKLTRVVHALEELTAREAVQLANDDYAGMLQTQGQAAPLVELLAQPCELDAASSLSARVAVVISRRADTQGKLAGRMNLVRETLHEISMSRRRVAQIAPAYGPMAASRVRNQFSAQG